MGGSASTSDCPRFNGNPPGFNTEPRPSQTSDQSTSSNQENQNTLKVIQSECMMMRRVSSKECTRDF
ncbi:hypothetical protein PFLUV_G00090900 [Perca fluviatilis]|uniref:Uncharacterized protein n=1 Tax=Perca fluviatilis TaxID=8168 RepID=A0A6A5FAQ6_PERFL|nr:hypothetical protein PFLUV_G00090900 [Perca fluviatilis]